MQAVLIKLIPIFLFFGLGVLLKKIRFADAGHGDFLLKFVFFVTLPALVLVKLSQTPIPSDKIYLPLIAVTVNVGCMLLTWFVLRFLTVERKTRGTMMVGTMIINNAFMFPFIIAGFGDAGFADAVLFDFGNGVMTATAAYMIAFRYGEAESPSRTMLIKLVKSPLSWALGIAVWLSCSSARLPGYLADFLAPMGDMTSPLILISLGIFFAPKLTDLRLALLAVSIRMGFGLMIGTIAAMFLGLDGTTFSVVALCSAAPIGFNTLTFASLARLDQAFASSLLSLSILAGVIFIPLVMLIFQQ